jgi:hypothetical protein
MTDRINRVDRVTRDVLAPVRLESGLVISLAELARAAQKEMKMRRSLQGKVRKTLGFK